jgi:integrase
MARRRRGRGEGSIEELPSSKFRVVLSVGKGQDGKRRKLTATFATKREAMEWRDEQKELLRRGMSAGSGRITTGDWLTRWLDIIKPKVANNTWGFYDFFVRRFLMPQVGTVRLDDLTVDRIEKMYSDLLSGGVSADAVRKAGNTLNAALQKAVRNRMLLYNPARDADKPAPGGKSTVRCLAPDEVSRFLAAAGEDRLYALYVLWLDSGAREGELFALVWGDVDWQGSAIRIVRSLEEYKGRLELKDVKTKGSRRRVVLSPFTMDALAEHRKAVLTEGHYRADGPVFCAPGGGWLRKSNFRRRSFDKVRRQAGLPRFRPYDLRHSTATMLLLAQESPKVVSERLGHSTVRMTLDTYSHTLPGMQERAAAKLDAILRNASFPACPTVVPQPPQASTG